MRRLASSGWTVLLAWGAGIALAVWFSAAVAQSPREDCERACREDETRCLEACGDGGNPVECEDGCRNDAWNCRNTC